MSTTIFLHGLDSSGQGTKGKHFSLHFPGILCPDFFGNLKERVDQLTVLCNNSEDLILIGSSFGGLMATCYATIQPKAVKQLILLAPALNFENFSPPAKSVAIPTLLIIGKNDTVTPPNVVLPLAKKTFTDLEVELVNDDHMLHKTFSKLPWQELLQPAPPKSTHKRSPLSSK